MRKDKYEISLWEDVLVPAFNNTYSWEVYRNGAWNTVNVENYPSAATPTLTFSPSSTSYNGYKYRCKVTLATGNVYSNEATLNVSSSLGNVITTHPYSQILKTNSVATFSVRANGSPIGYTWQVSKNGGSTWSNINKNKYPSALTEDLVFQAKSTMNNYMYRCIVKYNESTSVTSEEATLKVKNNPKGIIQQPSSRAVTTNSQVSFTVGVARTDNGHYEESKLAIIGSNTMETNNRAFDPVLVENVNGTHTLTFKMYYVYTEKGAEDVKIQNPFLNLLVNERKVKAYWKGQWYDFVIKGIQENSGDKSITYTCKDLFINELSKNGYNFEFDNELENNQGTAVELVTQVLDGTDWGVNEENDTIQQEKEEPVYEVTVTNAISSVTDQTTGETITVPINDKILVFYSYVQEILENTNNSGSGSIQFAYTSNYERDTNSQLVINADCCSRNFYWEKTVDDNNVSCIILRTSSSSTGAVRARIYYNTGVSSNYRASRLVSQQESVLDPLIERYVNKYKATSSGSGYAADDIIYGYKKIEFRSPLVVNNLVVNASDFKDTNGWLADDNSLKFQLYPMYDGDTNIDTYSATTYLRLKSGATIYNAGLRESSSYIPEGFQKGEKYIFRYKAMGNTTGTKPSGNYVTSGIDPRICKYTISEGIYTPVADSDYFSVGTATSNGNWVEFELTCIKSVTRPEIYSDKVGLFLTISNNRWLETAELFPYVEGKVGETVSRINPGEMDKQAISETYYYYYNHTANSGLLAADNLNYLYVGTTDWSEIGSTVQPVYNENFEKIRSISIKQSNRFNILQSIAETFECWIRFTIEHEESGKIKYVNGVPQKYVTILKDIGEDVGIGFIYGIDLKTISRTIQSDQIVTKTIVAQNNNEFAQNGFCTIARSVENYPRTNFILNFDYYISQGLINGGELNKDLYLSTDSIGYYYNLNKKNTAYDAITEHIGTERTELGKQEAFLSTYESYTTALDQECQNLLSDIYYLAGASSEAGVQAYLAKNPDHTELLTRINALQNARNTRATYTEIIANLEKSIAALKATIASDEAIQDGLRADIVALDYAFYKKYANYLQEGTWISEEYIDDTLYYLDAQSVAYTSSRPQISYNISVIRLSALEDFKNKVFKCGDISFIQDTEFFGYVWINGVKTPYKEKVLVSEVTSYFDAPERDTFKIQNYKTQFEDLFQRITATTQSLQYASGEYARAASVVEPNGTITPETLQNSIALNEQLVYSAQNEAIVQDSTGLTVTDTTNPNKKTKITSGGVFITTDGGQTWKNAVRGEGIATQYLTTGTINTNEITMMDGNFKTFKWDSSGINAYDQNEDYINLSKFVRFDHFGIYGLETSSDTYTPATESAIWNDAKFGMTWRGFFVKNNRDNHRVEVSSENDIQVVNTSVPTNEIVQIKIGKLGEGGYYGIRISDSSGTSVMETGSDGNLWLRNALHIGTTSSSQYVSIGYLDAVDTSKQLIFDGTTNLDTRSYRRSIDVNNKFAVWEDGTMYAEDGYFKGAINATSGNFTGTIHATGGTIGNMTIDAVEAATYKVVITSSNGTTFINGATDTKTLTATLVQGNTPVTTGLSYQWLYNGATMAGATNSQINVTSTGSNSIDTYTCIITVSG